MSKCTLCKTTRDDKCQLHSQWPIFSVSWYTSSEQRVTMDIIVSWYVAGFFFNTGRDNLHTSKGTMIFYMIESLTAFLKFSDYDMTWFLESVQKDLLEFDTKKERNTEHVDTKAWMSRLNYVVTSRSYKRKIFKISDWDWRDWHWKKDVSTRVLLWFFERTYIRFWWIGELLLT